MSFLSAIFGSREKIDYKQLLADGALIVDVRGPGEYAGGHIKGSINIPLDAIDSRMKDLKNKNKAIITCCRSGARSGMAVSKLSSHGLTAYNGGAWDSLNELIK